MELVKSVLSGGVVGLFGERLLSAPLRIKKSLSYGGEQIKDLFHRYLARLLRVPETDINEYKIFRCNSCANHYYVFS